MNSFWTIQKPQQPWQVHKRRYRSACKARALRPSQLTKAAIKIIIIITVCARQHPSKITLLGKLGTLKHG
jgi:hypothetical protein